jgi:predicted kinase
MAALHLISGLPGSGKTTYALRLRQERDAVLCSLDRWLITLFGRYALPAVGLDEHTRRVLACRELIWESAREFLLRNVDVILDDGFFYREHRMHQVALATAAGSDALIHYVKTPLDIVRARLERRNADLPRFNFHIDPSVLDGFLSLYQEPSADEGAEVVTVARWTDPRFEKA